MRHSIYLLCLLFIISLLAPLHLFAAPTYGTNMPEKGKGLSGYQSNIVFKHDLSDSYGNIKSTQEFYDISYGVFDWLTLDGKIGFGDLRQKGGTTPKVEYRSGFAGGYGFRLKVLNDPRNKVSIVTGFQHISVHPAARNLNNDKYEAILDDWQWSLVSSKDIGRFCPFLGARVSMDNLINRTNEIDRKQRPPLYCGGVVAGCSVKLKDGIFLSVETSFIDQTSLSAGLYCAF